MAAVAFTQLDVTLPRADALELAEILSRRRSLPASRAGAGIHQCAIADAETVPLELDTAALLAILDLLREEPLDADPSRIVELRTALERELR